MPFSPAELRRMQIQQRVYGNDLVLLVKIEEEEWLCRVEWPSQPEHYSIDSDDEEDTPIPAIDIPAWLHELLFLTVGPSLLAICAGPIGRRCPFYLDLSHIEQHTELPLNPYGHMDAAQSFPEYERALQDYASVDWTDVDRVVFNHYVMGLPIYSGWCGIHDEDIRSSEVRAPVNVLPY
ncbi:hypothetical protein MD484_g7078, partial [Candolleomyces efflorescens]